MRFISFKKDKDIKVGLELLGKGIIDLNHLDSTIPNNLNDIIKNFSSLESKIKTLNSLNNIHYKADEVVAVHDQRKLAMRCVYFLFKIY